MAYMKDSAGRRLDSYKVAGTDSVAARWAPRKMRAKLAPMAVPPTFGSGTTNGGSAANTALSGSTLISYTDAKLKYVGGLMEASPSNPSWYGQVRPVTGTSRRTISVCFGFDGQTFEWRTNGSGTFYKIWVNGVPATADWVTLPADGLDHLMTVNLGSRGTWDIRIETFNVYFGGVRVLPTDRIVPPVPTCPLRLHIVGDSITDGQTYTGGVTKYTPGYPYRLGEHLQIEDIWNRARGGTGFLTANSFRSRLADDVIPYAPDVLLIPCSLNDTNTTPAVGAIASEIQAIYAQVKAALPNCLLVGAGVLHYGNTNGNIDAVNAEAKTTWNNLGAPFIDLAPFNNGTGNADAPAGNGSADFNRSGDGVHASYPAGYDYTAFRLASGLAPILAAAN